MIFGFLAFLIAAGGIILFALLVSLIIKASNTIKLAKYRSKQEGLSDLLNYAAVVDDGIIVGKNGALMAAWLYKGEDNAGATNEEREMISFRINQALANKGTGWMIHIDAARHPTPSYSSPGMSNFPDPISFAVDEERRNYFNKRDTMYEGYFVITLTWFPPMLAQKKFVELMFDDDRKKPDNKSRTRELIEQFKNECLNFESHLSIALSLQRLRGKKVMMENGEEITEDAFLSWLQFCITGISQPVVLPNNPIYLDALIGGQELWVGTVPKIGNKFIQTVSIEGFPTESYPGMLTALAEVPTEYRWSSRYIIIDQHEALAHLDKFRKKWKQKVRGFFDQLFRTNNGIVDEDAVYMVADAAAAAAETNSGMVSQGYYNSVIVLMNEDRDTLESYALELQKTISRLGFVARIDTINTLEAYLGTLPGHGVENIRRPFINTMNFADLIPTSTIWTGLDYAPSPLYPVSAPPLMHCITAGQTPFRLNLHVRDLGHTIMFGPTRAGKSTHLGILALQMRRYQDARIFAFDKGMSMYPTCLAVGGQHYTIGSNDSKLAFAPLENLESRSRQSWAAEWIDSILKLNGVNTTPMQRNEIADAIYNMVASHSKTLSEFSVTIQDQAIREALQQYTIDGLMGHLLDAPTDGLKLSDFCVFELEELMGLGDKFALPVLLYLFHRIEESLDGRPTIIFLDEAWLMLQHPVFRDKIREWLKTLAKKNCNVLMATQNLSDASNSGILDVIVESTATKLFLPNVYACDEVASAIYARMGLNSRQIKIIASATPKRDYYYVSELGCRLYSLELGPLALAFVGATDKESIGTIQKLYAKHGEDWVYEWLRIKGVDISNYISDYGVHQ